MKAASLVFSRFAGIIAVAGIAASPHTALSKTVTADTVVSSLLCTDSISYPVRQDTLVTRTWRQQIGPVTIANVPVLSDTFPFFAGTYGVGGNLPLSGVDTIVFDSSSPPFSVTFRNLSAATISDLTITLFNSAQSAVLAPYDSATLSFPVAGDQITGGSIGITVLCTASGAGTIASAMNFNGLIADQATMLNSYVSFSKSFVKVFDLGDSLDIHYLDILDGNFLYALTNTTDLPLRADISQRHLWTASFCANHLPPLESAGDLATGTTHSDSFGMASKYTGYHIAVMQAAQHDSTFQYVTPSACRLFPVWMYDSADMKWKSAAPVEFLITPTPESVSRIVNIKSTDLLTFSLVAPNLKYRQMLATVMQEYIREGDTAKVKVPSPWDASSMDTLGKNAWADISMITRLPDSSIFQPRRAAIDTLGVTYKFFDPATTAASTQCSAKFLNVRDSMLLNQQADITGLMSLWPDSIYIAVKTTVPVGTRVLMVNELLNPLDPDYRLSMGLMNIKGDYTVNIYELTGVIARDMKKTCNGFDIRYANGTLIFSVPETFGGPSEVSLFSLSGRCIKKASFSGRGKIVLPVGRETAGGVYSVTVGSRSGSSTKKIIVR